jgi:hypothetical protein
MVLHERKKQPGPVAGLGLARGPGDAGWRSLQY